MEGSGACLVAVHQDASGGAQANALAYAKGIGGARAGVAGDDLPGGDGDRPVREQVILCGGVSALIKAAYKTLVDAGYQPESATSRPCTN